MKILDDKGRVVVEIQADGAIHDRGGHQVAHFSEDGRLLSVDMEDVRQKINMSQHVTLEDDEIILRPPTGRLVFKHKEGQLLLDDRPWGSTEGFADTAADRYRLAAGLLMVPLLPRAHDDEFGLSDAGTSDVEPPPPPPLPHAPG